MTIPVFDVALSCLTRDVPIANALWHALSPHIGVFVHEYGQGEVAPGSVCSPAVFLTESRLNVILFRDGYGDTPWTRAELAAIQERARRDGSDSLLVVLLSSECTPPVWHPTNRIHSSLADDGIPGIAALVLVRAHEVGARDPNETTIPLVARPADISRFSDRGSWSGGSRADVELIEDEVKYILDRVESDFARIAAYSADRPPDFERKPGEIIVNLDGKALWVRWDPAHSAILTGSELRILFYDGTLAIRHQAADGFPAKMITVWAFEPTFASRNSRVWLRHDEKELMSSPNVADAVISRLLQMARRAGA